MTETKATTGDSTDPGEAAPPTGSPVTAKEPGSNPSYQNGAGETSAETGTGDTSAAAGVSNDGIGASSDSVAADSASAVDAAQQLENWYSEHSERPSFTRPPGMPPPPNHVDNADTATIPSVAVPATATLTGSGTAAQATFSASPTGLEQGVDPAVTAPGSPLRAVRVGEVRPRVTTPRGPRRARLTLKRVDPWSVMKFSFAVSLVLFIVIVVAAAVLYLALDAMGVFSSANQMIVDLFQSSGGDGDPFRITAKGVIGTAAVLGGLNVLLFTSRATLGAFIYNVCADLVGGVEVTLAERD